MIPAVWYRGEGIGAGESWIEIHPELQCVPGQSVLGSSTVFLKNIKKKRNPKCFLTMSVSIRRAPQVCFKCTVVEVWIFFFYCILKCIA